MCRSLFYVYVQLSHDANSQFSWFPRQILTQIKQNNIQKQQNITNKTKYCNTVIKVDTRMYFCRPSRCTIYPARSITDSNHQDENSSKMPNTGQIVTKNEQLCCGGPLHPFSLAKPARVFLRLRSPPRPSPHLLAWWQYTCAMFSC